MAQALCHGVIGGDAKDEGVIAFESTGIVERSAKLKQILTEETRIYTLRQACVAWCNLVSKGKTISLFKGGGSI